MIDKATVEKIKAAADIVEVVSDYVHLTRRGSNYMGLCPFHNERTPSFSVNKRKNFCYCFSCHKGGSPVNFIMEKEGISYHDALLQLARKYGIKVEERELTDEERQAQSEREAMLVVNEWAMQMFEKSMHDTEEGRNIGLQYFFQRGVTLEAIKKFRLGYSPDKHGWLLEEARKAGYEPDVLKSVGLIGTSQDGKEYDRFRGRVIYPILNSAGKVIAFGGRDIKGVSPAKYINSPESAIYRKSNELYGIYQAKNAISRNGICFLVEGYMDVIGMWQSGMENVLASSGTALTEGQIALIHRFADEVILIYDGDNAGIKAALRGIDMLLAQKLKLKILLLPDGDDPDSFAAKHTPEEFRDFVEKNAVDVIRFKTQVLMKDAVNDPLKRSEAIHSIVKSIANIPDKIQRIAYIQECAASLNMPENIILSETESARAKIIEGWQRERQRKEAERDFPVSGETKAGGTDIMNSDVALAPHTLSSTPKSLSDSHEKRHTILDPFEKEIIRYSLKYGMITMCYSADIEGNEVPLSTLQFIEDELRRDEMSFTNPVYIEIFDTLRGMRPDFEKELIKLEKTLDAELEEEKEAGIRIIAEKNLDLYGIEQEEKRLEEQLENKYNESVLEFAMNYPGRELASHESDSIRRVVTELMRDPVILSKRFREMNNGAGEADRIYELVPRALAEWKDALLHCELIEVNSRLKEAASKGEAEEITRLQKEALKIMEIRKESAKSIGERILSCKR